MNCIPPLYTHVSVINHYIVLYYAVFGVVHRNPEIGKPQDLHVFNFFHFILSLVVDYDIKMFFAIIKTNTIST